MTKFFSALAVCGLAATSSAQITAFNFTDVDNSAGAPALNGFTTTDITIDFDSRWTGSQMLIELTQGEVYIDPLVDPFLGPPSTFTQTTSPSSAFGTYVTLNAYEAEGMPGLLDSQVSSIRRGAVNLGGDPTGEVTSLEADIAWSYRPPNPDSPEYTQAYFDAFQDQDDFLVSRVTLSDDADGTFKLLASAGGIITVTDLGLLTPASSPTDGLEVEGTIVNGAFVPEPASAAVVLAGLGLMAMRRRAA